MENKNKGNNEKTEMRRMGRKVNVKKRGEWRKVKTEQRERTKKKKRGDRMGKKEGVRIISNLSNLFNGLSAADQIFLKMPKMAQTIHRGT